MYIFRIFQYYNRAFANTCRRSYSNGRNVEFFNDLFDSVNGYVAKSDVPLRTVISNNSAHHTFWNRAITKLKSTQ